MNVKKKRWKEGKKMKNKAEEEEKDENTWEEKISKKFIQSSKK